MTKHENQMTKESQKTKVENSDWLCDLLFGVW